jgi:hypothetical protein
MMKKRKKIKLTAPAMNMGSDDSNIIKSLYRVKYLNLPKNIPD